MKNFWGLSWCIKDLRGTKVMYYYVVKWPVFGLQRVSAKSPLAPFVLGLYALCKQVHKIRIVKRQWIMSFIFYWVHYTLNNHAYQTLLYHPLVNLFLWKYWILQFEVELVFFKNHVFINRRLQKSMKSSLSIWCYAVNVKSTMKILSIFKKIWMLKTFSLHS